MEEDETKSDAEQATLASDSPTVAPNEDKMSTATNTATTTKSAPKAKKAKVAKTAKKAKTTKKANGKANGAKRIPRDGNKTQEVLAMLRKASGLTRAKILEHTGWKAVSVQQLVSNAGLNPEKDLKISDERPFTYRLIK